MNIVFTFILSNKNVNIMEWQFCCYSTATKAHKPKGQGKDSFAVSLNSSADTKV